MPEVLTRVDESPDRASKDYRRDHLFPQLRESFMHAGGYIAASLADNLDVPAAIALAFQDVADAYDLPIKVTLKSE